MKIFAGLPTYDGRRWNGRAMAALHTSGLCLGSLDISSSLLSFGFNQCWAAALNERAKGATHFLMLHADVVPQHPEWLTQFVLEMTMREGCQILSAAIPIKSNGGRVSAAIESDNPWNPHGLTVEDIKARPMTWTQPGLLVNSGLLLVDLRQPWVEHVCFTIQDRVTKNDQGKWIAEVFSEDWHFSRQAARFGVASWLTRRVDLVHMGIRGWSSPWQ